MRALDYLGVTLLGLDRPMDAREVLERAQAVTGTGDPRMRGILLIHFASTLNHLEQTDEALVSVHEPGRITEEVGDSYIQSVALEVPLVVSYDISDGMIQGARIYFMASTFFQQIGVA